MVSEEEYRKIRWQSRRGMRELDVLLLPFVERHFPLLDDAQQETYRVLLEQEDPVLLAWFNHLVAPADPQLAELVELIRSLHGRDPSNPP